MGQAPHQGFEALRTRGLFSAWPNGAVCLALHKAKELEPGLVRAVATTNQHQKSCEDSGRGFAAKSFGRSTTPAISVKIWTEIDG